MSKKCWVSLKYMEYGCLCPPYLVMGNLSLLSISLEVLAFGMLVESLKVPWESKEPKGRKVPLLSPKLRADYRANSAKCTVG